MATELEVTYRRIGGRVWRSIVAAFGDVELASDAVAEAFAQAAGRGNEIRDLEKWLWRSAFRIAAGMAKARPLTVAVAPDAPAVSQLDIDWELVAALRTLPQMQREAVVLRHIGGWSANDIADHLGSTPGSIRVQISNGLKHLRTHLEIADVS